MPQIEFTINKKTGKVEINGEGFEGTACSEAIRNYAEKLGQVTEHRSKEDQAVINRHIEQRI